MGIYAAALAFGIVSGSVIAIAAVGFSLQYAITNVLNIAYGGVMTVSAYATYVLNRRGVDIWVALIVSMGVGSALSYLLHKALYGPFRRRGASPVTLIVVSLAAAVMIGNLVLAFAGTSTDSLNFSTGSLVGIGAFQVSIVQLIILGIAFAMTVGVRVLLQRTRLGKAMRATATNYELAKNCGVRAERVITITWIISGALAGAAGTVFTMNSAALTPGAMQLFLIVVLAAVIVGGIGSPYGAMAGAMTVGIVTELAAASFNPEYKDVVAFLALVAVLLWRPQGIFVRNVRGAAR